MKKLTDNRAIKGLEHCPATTGLTTLETQALIECRLPIWLIIALRNNKLPVERYDKARPLLSGGERDNLGYSHAPASHVLITVLSDGACNKTLTGGFTYFTHIKSSNALSAS